MNQKYNRQTSLGMLSGKIHHLMKKELQRQLDLRKIPLKVEFYPVMNRLFEKDEVSQQTIADWLSFDRPRTSRMIDELEKTGWVIRKDDPSSKRTKLVYLSKFAKKKQPEILTSIQEAFTAAYKGFTKKEVTQIIENLQKIKTNLELK